MVEMYLCPSYYDDDGVLQDCKCGRCDEQLSNCCGAAMDGEPSNNSSDTVEGRCSDCKEMAEFGNQASELYELCKEV